MIRCIIISLYVYVIIMKILNWELLNRSARYKLSKDSISLLVDNIRWELGRMTAFHDASYHVNKLDLFEPQINTLIQPPNAFDRRGAA